MVRWCAHGTMWKRVYQRMGTRLACMCTRRVKETRSEPGGRSGETEEDGRRETPEGSSDLHPSQRA